MKPVVQLIDVETKEGQMVITPEKLQELLDQAYALGYTDGVNELVDKAVNTPPITIDPRYPYPYAPQPYTPAVPFEPLRPDIIWCGDDFYRKPLVGINSLNSNYCVMLRKFNEEE